MRIECKSTADVGQDIDKLSFLKPAEPFMSFRNKSVH